MIHTVKGFGIVNKAEVDVFLELSCFFHDPADVGNLISGSSAFSKSSLNIWKFMIHVLLKPGLENFEHYFASMWDKCWERLRAGGEGDDRGWDSWMASPTQWTRVWVDSGSWWWTGRPGRLQFMGSQRDRHDWATELNWLSGERQAWDISNQIHCRKTNEMKNFSQLKNLQHFTLCAKQDY